MSAHLSEAAYASLTGSQVPAKRSKYHAERVIVTESGELYEAKSAKANGITGRAFASKAEARRYLDLRLLERGGYIRDLECQPRFNLHGLDGSVVCKYLADFRYRDVETGAEIVEDTKGGPATVTPVYALKIKLLKAEYGVTVREIGR
jgi:hypothetical protein